MATHPTQSKKKYPTDPEIRARVEELLLGEMSATDIYETIKPEFAAVKKLTFRQFNARYTLQAKLDKSGTRTNRYTSRGGSTPDLFIAFVEQVLTHKGSSKEKMDMILHVGNTMPGANGKADK